MSTNTTTANSGRQVVEEEEEKQDEWVFSIHLPQTNNKKKQPLLIQMRQSQPQPPPPLYHYPSSQPKPPQRTRSDDKGGEEGEDDDEDQSQLLAAAQGERTSLLSSAKNNTAAAAASSARTGRTAGGTMSGGGWTLESPYWSIQSDFVLQVTYRPAWQALPEFTSYDCCCQACCQNGNKKDDSSSKNKKKMHWWTRDAISATVACCSRSRCCCRCCFSSRCRRNNDDNNSRVDFYTTTWTTRNVVSVREMDDYHITGIGSCHAIQVELQPLEALEEEDNDNDNALLPPVPPSLKDAWERHLQHIQKAQQDSTGRSESRDIDDDDDDDDEIGYNDDTTTTTTTNNNNKGDGPTVMFCLPRHQVDPPLLWRVYFPPLTQTAVAIETMTVMEGSLLVGAGQQQQQQQQQQQSSSLAANKAADAPSRHSTVTATTTTTTGTNPSIHQTTNPISTSRPSPTNSSTNPRPTHIYITGYQSWSFAGSVAQGCKQPTSALPKLFSGAFNLGGTPPPESSTSLILPLPTTTRTKMKTKTTAMLTSKNGNFKTGGSGDDDDNEDDTEFVNENEQDLFPYDEEREAKADAFYQSDFFTCITSDGGQHNESFENKQERSTTTTRHLDERGGPAVLLGWLAQHEQFGVITADKSLQQLAMHASVHGQIVLPESTSASSSSGRLSDGITTDWAYVQLVSPHSYDEEPMVHYLHSVAAFNQARPLQNGPLLTGWCSWYHYYENISESNLRENFAKLSAMRTKVPTNVAVVDDGYMTAWGDWDSLKPHRFSNTMGIVSRDIQAQGMRPGLWLAPFAADKNSKLVQDHPEWIIRNDRGIPANSSFCGKFFYGLDATNPAVRKHVHESIRRAVHDWGFTVLKIDFLYAACLHGNGKYDLSMSRAQAMHLALQTIRDAAGPNVFLIGCGCPIATGIGFVDGMRISADTGPTWKPAPPLPSWDHSTLPSLRAMVRNSMSRAPLGHRWWHNDPDCLLLGESTRLSDEEVATAATIVAMTCGMMLLSDDLTRVSLARMRILTKIFPMIGATAVVLDLHSSASEGLPSLLRLWCSDKYNLLDPYRESLEVNGGGGGGGGESFSSWDDRDHNAEATFFARAASFQFDDDEITSPNERRRSCIHVTKGLGTWTVVSISNWSDKAEVVHVPELALLPPPSTVFDARETDSFLDLTSSIQTRRKRRCNGYHVFSFWSSKYSWLPDQTLHSNNNGDSNNNDNHVEEGYPADYSLSKRLAPHETEIFHIKPVTPDRPQYIGSDLHFSCGQEVRSFRATAHSLQVCLKTDHNRVGHIFIFVPRIHTDHNRVQVTVNGKPGRGVVAVGNVPSFMHHGEEGDGVVDGPRLVGRVLCIPVVVHADGSSSQDGQVNVEF